MSLSFTFWIFSWESMNDASYDSGKHPYVAPVGADLIPK